MLGYVFCVNVALLVSQVDGKSMTFTNDILATHAQFAPPVIVQYHAILPLTSDSRIQDSQLQLH